MYFKKKLVLVLVFIRNTTIYRTLSISRTLVSSINFQMLYL